MEKISLWLSLLLAGALNASGQLIVFNLNDLAGGATTVTESQVPGTPTLTLAGVDVVPAGQAGVAYTDASGTPHAAGLAAAWGSGINDPEGNRFTLRFDATGFQDFYIRYDYRSTASGSPTAVFRYQVGATGTFTDYGTDTYTQDGAFHSMIRDLSPLAVLNNAGDVYLQWELAAGSASGTFRMDNLEVTGSAVPEPSGCALVVGLGLVGFAAFRQGRGRGGLGACRA